MAVALSRFMYKGASTSSQPTLAAQATPILRGSRKRWSMRPSSRQCCRLRTRSGSLPLSTTVMQKGTSRVVWFRASMVAQVAVGRLNTGMTTLLTGPVLQTGPVGAAAAAKTSIEMPSYAPTW